MQQGDRAIYFVDRSPAGEWIPHGQGQGILKLTSSDVVEHSEFTLSQVRALVHDALPGATASPVTYTYRIVAKFPHDTGAFTQGLELVDNALYEGTGLLGASSLRQVDLSTGAVTRRVDVPEQYFGEGITIFNGKIYQLTWLSGVGFVYDLATFARIGEFNYPGEGWGLTHDDQQLIMSDGTSQIRFLDPESLQTTRTIDVVDGEGSPVVRLNELEYVNGQIYANIWQTDTIARIDPASGHVTGWINLQGLLPAGTSADVLNGIAFDRISGRLFVTGKLWPWLFQIALDPVH
jgi:glutamine cyclotransferase